MDMKHEDLYGFRLDDLDAAKQSIDRALHVTLKLHDSSYYCGDYYRLHLPEGEELILQLNFDNVENELAEEEFPGFPILFWVCETARSAEIEELLRREFPDIVLLRRGKD